MPPRARGAYPPRGSAERGSDAGGAPAGDDAGEKVVADIRDARDHLNSEAGILPLLDSVSRRLRAPLAPGAGADRAKREGAR